MRHRKSFNHLSRKKGHRKALLANMASSLILHKRIKTTTAKAKALRTYVEPLITKSKNDSTHSRRVVFSRLQSKEAVTELFREISPRIGDRPGGYTRILKTGFRFGDNADMCVIELVDYNENMLTAKSEAEAKTGKRRRRGSRKKAAEELHVAEKPAVESAETPEETGIPDEKEVTAEQPEEEQKLSQEDTKKETSGEVQAEVKDEQEAEVKDEQEAETKAEAMSKEVSEKPAESDNASKAQEEAKETKEDNKKSESEDKE
jgi:large subunit ribosomal protein L17